IAFLVPLRLLLLSRQRLRATFPFRRRCCAALSPSEASFPAVLLAGLHVESRWSFPRLSQALVDECASGKLCPWRRTSACSTRYRESFEPLVKRATSCQWVAVKNNSPSPRRSRSAFASLQRDEPGQLSYASIPTQEHTGFL